MERSHIMPYLYNMAQITITQATINDLSAVLLIGRQTFAETFTDRNTAENMQQYLEASFNDEKISAELNDPASYFYIAWEEETPVGYLKLNTGKAQTEQLGDAALEIERIYVKAAYHGKKIGQLLYEKALEVASSQQKEYIWLGVWEENTKAIGFYSRNGFVPFDKHIFMVGEDPQQDVLMKKVL